MSSQCYSIIQVQAHNGHDLAWLSLDGICQGLIEHADMLQVDLELEELEKHIRTKTVTV